MSNLIKVVGTLLIGVLGLALAILIVRVFINWLPDPITKTLLFAISGFGTHFLLMIIFRRKWPAFQKYFSVRALMYLYLVVSIGLGSLSALTFVMMMRNDTYGTNDIWFATSTGLALTLLFLSAALALKIGSPKQRPEAQFL